MDGGYMLKRLQFDDYFVIHQQIEPIAAFQVQPLVNHGQRNLMDKGNTPNRQLAAQTFEIDRFQQSRPKLPMNLDRGPDNASCAWVPIGRSGLVGPTVNESCSHRGM